MTEADLWLERHTIFCERNAARFRPEVCEERRKENHVGCRGCLQDVQAEQVTVVEVAPRVYRKDSEKESAVTKKKTVEKRSPRLQVCVECGRTMPITGRGLCGKCYYIARRGDKESPEAAPEVQAAPIGVGVEDDGCDDSFAWCFGAVAGPDEVEAGLNTFADCLAIELSEVGRLLLAKNLAYGNSALNPVRIFSKADPVEQIRVRLDDKLSRLMRGGADDGEDTEFDLLGYLLLLRVAKRMAQ